jgi:MFS transporter, DHA1 family, inner membrane transport protein
MENNEIASLENPSIPFQGNPHPQKRATLIILVLILGNFALGTTEFMIAGLMQILSKHLHVSVPTAGWIMTSYALTVTITAPLITIITIKLRRKHLLILLMALLVIGSVISSFANTFSTMILGRVISGLSHGVFLGTAAVVASHIVTPEKRSMAITTVFLGISISNVFGVPLATLMGEYWGWHTPFYAVTILAIISWIGISIVVPGEKLLPETHMREEIKEVLRPEALLSLLVTAFGNCGLFGTLCYIAPLLINITGYTQTNFAYLLILFGAALVCGNYLGGKAAHMSVKKSLYVFYFLLFITLLSFSWTSHDKWGAATSLFFLGLFGFGIIPCLQIQLMKRTTCAPTLSSSTNFAAFNLGMVLGFYFGGLGIHYGFGYLFPSLLGAAFTAISALVFLLVNRKYPLNEN